MSKPKFDPSKPFEEAKAQAKPKFDTSKPFAPEEGKKAEGPAASEAFAQGLAQGGTLGYANEAQAASYPIIESLMDLVSGGKVKKAEEALAKQGIKDVEDSYESRLAENKKRDSELKDSGAYVAGDVLGSLVSTAVPGGIAAKAGAKAAKGAGTVAKAAKALAPATSTSGKLLQAGAAGGAMGALENPGEEGSRADNALLGLLTGGVGQGVVEGVAKGGKAVVKGLGMASGLGEKPIETYLKRGKEIDAMAGKYGDDIQAAAKDTRESILEKILGKKKELGGKVAKEFRPDGSTPLEYVPPKALLDEVDSLAAKVNPRTNPEDLAALELLREKIGAVTTKQGIPVAELDDLKRAFYKDAQGAYTPGHKLFGKGDSFAQSSKALGSKVRSISEEVRPGIKEANKTLSRMHEIDSAMGNLLKSDADANSLVAAGRNSNKNRALLDELSKITGENFTKKAEDLAALKAFANPDLVSGFTTGRSATLPLLGALAGGYSGGTDDAAAFGLGAAALSNPAILKKLLQGASRTGLPKAYGVASSAAEELNPYLVGAASERLEELMNR